MRVLLVGLVGGMFSLLPVSSAEEEPTLSGEVLLKYGESTLQVGYAGQSHFTALFRLPVSLTSKAY